MHIKCGMGSINRHAPSRTVPKTWKTVHSDLPFKMVKITELKVCVLQTRPYRLYVKHRLLTAEWTKSISCRWERPISYLIRRMLIDISLLISPLQPLRLDIKRKLTARSDRVKSVDLHPTEPWMVVSLYSGTLVVWNHESQVTISPFHIPLTHTHTQSLHIWFIQAFFFDRL